MGLHQHFSSYTMPRLVIHVAQPALVMSQVTHQLYCVAQYLKLMQYLSKSQHPCKRWSTLSAHHLDMLLSNTRHALWRFWCMMTWLSGWAKVLMTKAKSNRYPCVLTQPMHLVLMMRCSMSVLTHLMSG